jgi:cytochrome c5
VVAVARPIVLVAMGGMLTVSVARAGGGDIIDASAAREQLQRAERRSVLDGVYNADQAERGAAQYKESCERCHLAELTGNPVEDAPSLVRDAFVARWGGKTLRDLFDTISRTMPADDPGTLNRRAAVDVIAYILHVNGYPLGEVELDRDPQVLQRIVVDGEAPRSAK